MQDLERTLKPKHSYIDPKCIAGDIFQVGSIVKLYCC